MSCNLFAVCFGRSPGRSFGQNQAAHLEARLLPVDKNDDHYLDGSCVSKSTLDPERFYAQLAREKSCCTSRGRSGAAQRSGAAARASEDGATAARGSVDGEAEDAAVGVAQGPSRKSYSNALGVAALPPRAASDTGAFFRRPAPPFANTFTCALTTPAQQHAESGRCSHNEASSSNKSRRLSLTMLTGAGGYRGNQVAPAPAELRAMAAASGRGGGSGACQLRGSDGGGGNTGGGMHLAATAEVEEEDSDSGDGGMVVPRSSSQAHRGTSECAEAGVADQVAAIVQRGGGSASFTSTRASRPSATAARSRRSHSGDDPLAVALGIMRSGSSETSHSRNKAAEVTAAVAERRRSTSLARRSRSGGSGGGPPPPGTPPVLTHNPSPPRSRSCSKPRERRASCDAMLHSQTSSQVAELHALLGQQSIDIPGRCKSFGGDGKAAASGHSRRVCADSNATLQGKAQPAAASARSFRQSGGQEAAAKSGEARSEDEGDEAARSEELLTQRRQAWLLGSCMKISRSQRRRTRPCDYLDEEQEVRPAADKQQQDQGCTLPRLTSGSDSAVSSHTAMHGAGSIGCASRGRDAAGAVMSASQSSGAPPQALVLPASEPGCVFGDASTRAEQFHKQQQSMPLSADGGTCVDGDVATTAAPAVSSTAVTADPPAAVTKAAGIATDSSPCDGLANSHSVSDSDDERDAEIASAAASAVGEWRASRAASLASLASREVSSTGSNLLDSAEDLQCRAAAINATAAAADMDDAAAAGARGGAFKCPGPGRQSAHRLSWAGNAASSSDKQLELQPEASSAASRAGIHDEQSELVAAVGPTGAAAAEPDAPAQRLCSSRSRRCSIAGEVVAGVQEPGESGRRLAGATSVRWQQSRSLRPARSILKKSPSHAPREAHVSVRDDTGSEGADAIPLANLDNASAMSLTAADGGCTVQAARCAEQRQPMPDPEMPPLPPAAGADQEQQVQAQQEHTAREEEDNGDGVMLPGPCDGTQLQGHEQGEQLPVGADSEPFGRPPSRRNSRSPGPGDTPSTVLKQGSRTSAVTSRCGSNRQAAEQPASYGTAAAEAGDAAASTAEASGDAAPYGDPAGCSPANPISGMSGPSPALTRGRNSRASSCCSQAGLQRCGSGSSSVASHPFMTAVTQAARAATAKTSLCETTSHVVMSSGAMSDSRPWGAGCDYEDDAQEGQQDRDQGQFMALMAGGDNGERVASSEFQ